MHICEITCNFVIFFFKYDESELINNDMKPDWFFPQMEFFENGLAHKKCEKKKNVTSIIFNSIFSV